MLIGLYRWQRCFCHCAAPRLSPVDTVTSMNTSLVLHYYSPLPDSLRLSSCCTRLQHDSSVRRLNPLPNLSIPLALKISRCLDIQDTSKPSSSLKVPQDIGPQGSRRVKGAHQGGIRRKTSNLYTVSQDAGLEFKGSKLLLLSRPQLDCIQNHRHSRLEASSLFFKVSRRKRKPILKCET